MSQKVCIFTGTRAEYGLLQPVMQRIKDDRELELQVLVSGGHLSTRHGNTIDEIFADGFVPSEQVPLPLDDDSPIGVAEATGIAVSGLAKALGKLSPDIVVILGDRYEALACALAASIQDVPIAHIHGGETTQGAVDECFRHSITKMSQLHFPSCEEARKRIIQLGENPERVFNVGALGVENIKNIPLLSKEELEDALGFRLGRKCLLVTYHPVTLDKAGAYHAAEFFGGLRQFLANHDDGKIILTGTNADVGGSIINELADQLANENLGRVGSWVSLGLVRYLSAMKYASCVVGNSSSGIIEAPSFYVPVVNIGIRQQGRVQSKCTINCAPNSEDVERALDRALSSENIQSVRGCSSPYEKKGTSEQIVKMIKGFSGDTIKVFYDIKFGG